MSGANMPRWFAVLAVTAGLAVRVLASTWFYLTALAGTVAYILLR